MKDQRAEESGGRASGDKASGEKRASDATAEEPLVTDTADTTAKKPAAAADAPDRQERPGDPEPTAAAGTDKAEVVAESPEAEENAEVTGDSAEPATTEPATLDAETRAPKATPTVPVSTSLSASASASPSLSPSASADSGWRARWPRLARGLVVTVTSLAVAFVVFTLIAPNDLTKFEAGRFLRIPAEGILGAALLLVLPPRARRVWAVVAGLALGGLIVVKVLDLGSYWTLDRPFDLVLDWPLLDNARTFMADSLGAGTARLVVIGLIVLVIVLIVLLVLSTLRISRVVAENRHLAGRTLLVLGTVWITCSTLALETAGVPVASHSAATLVGNRVEAIQQGIEDGEEFEKQAAVDAFEDVPPDQWLTGLRGKDVLITFIESYGRSAIDDPRMGEPLGRTLEQKTQELKDAGFASRSGWLRSPITGAGSWLGHSTFLSGLWIKNQSRYDNLVVSDRLTLTEAFRRTGDWRTVGIVPGTQKAWPEGEFFGLDHIYDSDELGYKGPKFSWSTMPDQYTLKAFRELEHGRDHSKPIMAEIILTSSHNPWAPIPRTIPEEEVGDGSVYHSLQKAEGKDPKQVWKDPLQVRDEYRKSIAYSVSSIVDYVAKYGSEDTVLVFLGDHQPNKTVTGPDPSHDVPVSVVAKDPKILERIADWGWTDGLKPAANAPQWRMDAFRDRFMTAFGPQGAAPAPTP